MRASLGDAAAIGEGMGAIRAGHLENQEVQVSPFWGLLSFVAVSAPQGGWFRPRLPKFTMF